MPELKHLKCKCGFTLTEKKVGDRTLGARMATHMRYCSTASPNAAAGQRRKLADRLTRGRGQRLHARTMARKVNDAQAVVAPVAPEVDHDIPMQMNEATTPAPAEPVPPLPPSAPEAPQATEPAQAPANAPTGTRIDTLGVKSLLNNLTQGKRVQNVVDTTQPAERISNANDNAPPAYALPVNAQIPNAQAPPKAPAKPVRKAKDVVQWGMKDWTELANELHNAEGSIAVALSKCDEAAMPEGLKRGMSGLLGRLLTIMWDEMDLPMAMKVMVTLYATLQLAYMGHVGKAVHEANKQKKIEAQNAKDNKEA